MTRLVPYRLAVRRDGENFFARIRDRGNYFIGCVRKPFTEIEIETAILRRRRSRHRGCKTRALGGLVRDRDETEQLDIEAIRAARSKTRRRSADSVKRCSGHQSDDDVFHFTK